MVLISSAVSKLLLLVVVSIYMLSTVPQTQVLQIMKNYWKYCGGVKNPAVVVGDFNYPHANWGTLTGCSDSRALIDTSLDMFWSQYVDFSTHQSGNILDLVFAEEGMINEVKD